MGLEIFLGKPPPYIKQWIDENPTPHAETRFTFQDGTVKPESITGPLDDQWMIANRYFDMGTWLKTIIRADIGNTVTSIGNEAFWECQGLTSVAIPDSVMSITYEAFYKCTSLTSVAIPDSVTNIGASAFQGCTRLTSVAIGNHVTSIGEDAFSGCGGLTSVTIPDSVTSVGGTAFSNCGRLASVTIGRGVTSIGEFTFMSCESLMAITVLGKTTEQALALLANADYPEGCTIVGIPG